MAAFWSRFFGRGGDTIHVGDQRDTFTNKAVTFDTAMTQSAYWASVRLLTETVASMPVVCYKSSPSSNIKEIDVENQLWKLINYMPNRHQTRVEFLESLMLNLCSRGNCYSAIERRAGRIISLIPLPSAQTKPVLMPDNSVIYEYTDAEGNVKIYSEGSIWHIKLFGNGIVGLSPLQYAAKTLGLSRDLSDRQSELASNGGKTNGILTCDRALTKEQKEAVKKSYAGLQQGNSNNLFVLEADFKYQQASLSPLDMQLLESRRFSIEDIARFMGVPSVLINDTSASTTWGSGIEQINMGFYKLNLRPYLVRIEASLKRHLMDQKDWSTVDIEFDFDDLLRADKATRLESQSKAVNAGLLMPNEGRALEGLPAATGGDNIYLNSTLVPAGTNANQAVTDES